jgi:glucose-6-phosphate 1-epimerase
MTLADLNENFAIPGQLAFTERDSMTVAQVTLPSASATIYLHGAHVTEWTPAGEQPVLYLSKRSEFKPGKAVRGGVPICFPWFGGRTFGARPDGQPSPSHGFARVTDWEFAFAALVGNDGGDALNLTFTLGPSDLSRAMGFDYFSAVYEVIVGKTLTMRLTVANPGTESMHYEEALHAYFAVGDIHQTTITGLEGAAFLDKTDGLKQKHTPDGPLQLTAETDSVFPANAAPVTIHDQLGGRTILIEKAGSHSTIVWNPWATLAAKLADLGEDAWQGFVCVEAANAGSDAITLPSGQTHVMQMKVSVFAHDSLTTDH